MAYEETKNLPESYPMAGGDAAYSYSKYSFYQGLVMDATQKMVSEAIADKLDLDILKVDTSKAFQIADLGCSIGPNTFLAVQNIIDAVEQKYLSENQNPSALEFQVLFNDHFGNDFNTLFNTLPPSRKYFATAVPGSFHGRLFPRSSLHFVYSSYALHWLSKLPAEIVVNKTPAWNKGSIYCSGLVKEVMEACSAQYKNDMECLLTARAQEIVPGGLMAIVISTLPNGITLSSSGEGKLYDLLGTCLLDLAKMGLIDEEKVKSFNFPIYYPSPNEIEDIVQRNGLFSIERTEIFAPTMTHMPISADYIASSVRAVNGGLVKKHFGGNEIVDQIFDYFTIKIPENLSKLVDTNNQKKFNLFILLKRNIN